METSLSTFFELINLAIMPLWFGLLLYPRKRVVSVAIDVFIAFAALLFVINLIPGLSELLPILLKPNFESVSLLLSTPRGTFGGWTHFVIGDLWVGRWISQDAHLQGIARPWVIPILFLTLLFGPVGLLTYFIVKLILTKRFGTAS
jgi:hypothetical protein